MRPVDRGDSPKSGDFKNYRDAYTDLLARLGPYCSYCERRIPANLAVEHIQPKAVDLYPDLEGRWDNYLLACVNCNSTKGNKDVRPENFYLPDRDNTLAAFNYRPDGVIEPRKSGDRMAIDSLELTGLGKTGLEVFDDNGRLIAIDRIRQRMEAWLKAERSKNRLTANPSSDLVDSIVDLAQSEGFFSVWWTVFEDYPELRNKFLNAFLGTSKECFDSEALLISKRPNNGLKGSGKI